jgi:hypothetical protein
MIMKKLILILIVFTIAVSANQYMANDFDYKKAKRALRSVKAKFGEKVRANDPTPVTYTATLSKSGRRYTIWFRMVQEAYLTDMHFTPKKKDKLLEASDIQKVLQLIDAGPWREDFDHPNQKVFNSPSGKFEASFFPKNNVFQLYRMKRP